MSVEAAVLNTIAAAVTPVVMISACGTFTLGVNNRQQNLTTLIREAAKDIMPQSDSATTRKNLPHWRDEGALYFVTWRLHRDQSDLSFAERALVRSALRHFDGQRYLLGAYVVMNDHVHVMTCPLPPYALNEVTHSWRSFTANQMQRACARPGVIWQAEPHDRILRSAEEARQKADYILNNPFRRWPELREYEWMGNGELPWQ